MSAREEILRRIRASGAPTALPIPRAYLRAGDLSIDDPSALFADRVADYGGTVHQCRTDEVADTVRGCLSQRGVRRAVLPAGLPPNWLPNGVELLSDDPPLTPAQLEAADGVISGCAVAVAVTGTIVLDAGAGQGRRALTLVPDYHLVIVTADQVVAGIPDAIARLDPSRPLTWVSGPSATSDIELQRIEGVHGPRTLDVVCVD
jgi:L-lactate dehydrogenase complex protein LldG